MDNPTMPIDEFELTLSNWSDEDLIDVIKTAKLVLRDREKLSKTNLSID